MTSFRKSDVLVVVGYGLVLCVVMLLAGFVPSPGASPQAPVVVAGFLQLAALAVLIPFWVVGVSGKDRFRALTELLSKMAQPLLVGLIAAVGCSRILRGIDIVDILLVQAVVTSFAVGAAGCASLVLTVVRKRSASQLLSSLILLGLLSAPLWANTFIRRVGPEHRTLVISSVSYSSGMVVTAYAAGVDFYRGPRMYVWSVVGDYGFKAPRTWVACALYLGVGALLIGLCWPLRPRLN